MSVTETKVPADRQVLFLTPIRSSQQARSRKKKMELSGKKFRMYSETPKFCRKHGIALLYFEKDILKCARFSRINCNSWRCPDCAKIKAAQVKNLIKEVIMLNNLGYFLTLTLDPGKIPCKCLPQGDNLTHKYITKLFNTLLTNLRRKYSGLKYVWVVEFQANGNAHLHILLDKRLDINNVRIIWTRIGGGHIMKIEQVRSLIGIASYLSNYIVKGIKHVEASSNLHYFEKRYAISRSCIRTVKSTRSINPGGTISDLQQQLDNYGLNEVYNLLQSDQFADGEEIIFVPNPPGSPLRTVGGQESPSSAHS